MDKRVRLAIKRGVAWLCLKTVYGAVRFIPQRFIYPLGNWLGNLGFWIAGKHRGIAFESLNIAFGKEMDCLQIRRIAKENFRHMAKGGLELLFFLERPKIIKERVSIAGKQHLDSALSLGKGVIGLTAHLGNFPLLGARLKQEGYKVNFLARPMRDGKADSFFQAKRDQWGVGTISTQPRRECVENCLRCLRNDELLLIQMDQNFGTGGVFVEFFGREAATPVGPVVFSLRTGASILPIFIIRQKDDTHQIQIDSPVILNGKGNKEEMILSNVARLTEIIESYVRRYPTQWSWIHRRWKSRPGGN